MQENAFKEWLLNRGLAPSYSGSRLSFCRRVARAEQIDLDQEFDRDQLEKLISHLTYTRGDAVQEKANPTKIKINGLPFTVLDRCRRSVDLYKRFRLGETKEIIENIEDAETEVEDISPAENSEIAFGMESQLRDFIAQNIQTILINGKKLSLYDGGVEYYTDAGFIDILAVDAQGNFFVFELKRGRTPDYVIGQLVRYMGWVKQSVGKDKEVHGVIVAKTIKENLHYAKAVVPNISLLKYEVKFDLKDAVRGED
ncbi:MAG: endonuclease NucS [bacterium]|nr:endonuclease NucS [bacterium]